MKADVKKLPLLSGPELAAALDKIEEIQAWCRAVQAEALSRAEQKSPDAAPGWKIAEGRKGDRTADPEAVLLRVARVIDPTAVDPSEVQLPKELFTAPQLKSVAQIEGACKKLGPLGKAIWEAIKGRPADPDKGDPGIPGLITQPSGRPTLVRDFDSRPELAPQPVAFELRPVNQEFSAAPHLGAAEGLM